MPVRLEGLVEGSTDSNHDVSFVLKTCDGAKVPFVASAASTRQISAGLGRMAADAGRPTHLSPESPEKVAKFGVKREAFGKAVLLQLISDDGVSFMFTIPPAAAKDIASRLQAEAVKERRHGSA